jgi:hypothetical protein
MVGYDPIQGIGRFDGEYKKLFKREVKRFKDELKVDGLSLAAQESQLITEGQKLQNSVPGETEMESLIYEAKKN